MDRKIRKMKKIELLELLLEQEKEIENLQAQIEQLQNQLDIRTINIAESGSIAQAALKLSGVFEAAQEAADLYLKSIIRDSDESAVLETHKPSDSETDKSQNSDEDRNNNKNNGNLRTSRVVVGARRRKIRKITIADDADIANAESSETT